tara:strand:+ start:293 stop:727 length:435 start_codon:yes stop_codon:yes gene_type:complete
MPNKTAREKLNKLVAKRKKLNARTTAGKKTILGNLRKKRIQNKINKNTAAISDAKKPKVTKPKVTKPKVTKPKVTKPKVTKPKVTKPKVTKPKVTKPKVGDERTSEKVLTKDKVKTNTTKVKTNTPRPTGGRGGGKPKSTRRGR